MLIEEAAGLADLRARPVAPIDGSSADQRLGGAADDVNGYDGLRASLRALSPSPPSVSKLDIVFDERLGKEKDRGKLVRYQINPRANWGPMNRAGGV